MKSEFKKVRGSGVGGIKCPCCRPAGCATLKQARGIMARKYRRSAYSSIVSQMEDIAFLLAAPLVPVTSKAVAAHATLGSVRLVTA